MKLLKLPDGRVVRANRYRFNKPHDRANAQLRRLRQIARGQIKCEELTAEEASDLLLQAMQQIREQAAASSDRTPKTQG